MRPCSRDLDVHGTSIHLNLDIGGVHSQHSESFDSPTLWTTGRRKPVATYWTTSDVTG